jgi:hypothetical protein
MLVFHEVVRGEIPLPPILSNWSKELIPIITADIIFI